MVLFYFSSKRISVQTSDQTVLFSQWIVSNHEISKNKVVKMFRSPQKTRKRTKDFVRLHQNFTIKIVKMFCTSSKQEKEQHFSLNSRENQNRNVVKMFNSVCFQIKTRKGTMVSLSKLVKSFSNYRGSVSQKRTKVFVRNSHKLEEKHVLLISVSGFSSKSQTKDISFRQFTMKFSREKS